MSITEYQILLTGGFAGAAVGLILGAFIGWLLVKIKQEEAEAIKEAERNKPRTRWTPPDSFNCRCSAVKIGAAVTYGRREAEPRREEGDERTKIPPRPFLPVAEMVRLDRSEMLTLADLAMTTTHNHDLYVRAANLRVRLEQSQ